MRRVWKTKQGKSVRIRDMATSHIQNCIKMLERYNQRKVSEILSMPEPFGEEAAFALENAIDDFLESGCELENLAEEYIESFKQELHRRQTEGG